MVEENIFMLVDDEGNEEEYEFLSLVTYEGNDYGVFMSTKEEEEDVLILMVETDETGRECLVTVDDEAILQKVIDLFKEEEKDNFDFIEE